MSQFTNNSVTIEGSDESESNQTLKMQCDEPTKSETLKKPFNPAPGSNRRKSSSNNVPHFSWCNFNLLDSGYNPVEVAPSGLTPDMFIPGERECHGDIERMMKTAQRPPRSLARGPIFDVAKLAQIMSDFSENLLQNQHAKNHNVSGTRELTAMQFNEEQLRRQQFIQLDKPTMTWDPNFYPLWYTIPSQQVVDSMYRESKDNGHIGSTGQQNWFPTFVHNSTKWEPQSAGQNADMTFTNSIANMKVADTGALQSNIANPNIYLPHSYGGHLCYEHGLKSGQPVSGVNYMATPQSQDDGIQAQLINPGQTQSMLCNNIPPCDLFGFQSVNNSHMNSNLMADPLLPPFNSNIPPNPLPPNFMGTLYNQRSDGIPMAQQPLQNYICPSAHVKPNPFVNNTNALTSAIAKTVNLYNLQQQLANAQLTPNQPFLETMEPMQYRYDAIPTAAFNQKPWLVEQAHSQMTPPATVQPISCVQPNSQVLPQLNFQHPNFVTEPTANECNYPNLATSTCPRHAESVLMPETPQENFNMCSIAKSPQEPVEPINILEYVKSLVATSNASRGNQNINHHNNIFCQTQPAVADSSNYNSDQDKRHMPTTAKWRSETNMENGEMADSMPTPSSIDENICQLETDNSGKLYEHKKRSELAEGIAVGRKTCRRGRPRGVREVFGIITPHHGNNNINDKVDASPHTFPNTKATNANINKISGKRADIAKAVISLFDDNISRGKGVAFNNYNSNPNNNNLHINNQDIWPNNLGVSANATGPANKPVMGSNSTRSK